MDNIKDKIGKLLAMAHDGRGNEFEAEAALRQAEKLMRKHGIEVAELQAATGQKPFYKWRRVSVPAGSPQPVQTSPLWFGFLISAIGRFTDTKVSYTRIHPHGICAEFAGDEIDVEYAVYLCKHLRDNCRSQSAVFIGDRAEKESFRKAYAIRVGERMAALLEERKAALEAVKTSAGTALMIVDQKLTLRDEEFGRQTYGRATSVRLRATGATAGRAAGDCASINRPLSGQSAQRLA